MDEKPKIDVEHLFTYHRPTPEQPPLYERINAASKKLGMAMLAEGRFSDVKKGMHAARDELLEVIAEVVPEGEDRGVAENLVRRAVLMVTEHENYTAGIRKLRTARMFANAGIACDGRVLTIEGLEEAARDALAK